ncbi:MAG: chromosomal replication initiator protein DnaA [Planctomycetota bacterium]
MPADFNAHATRGTTELYWNGFVDRLRGLVHPDHFDSWLSRLACRRYNRDSVDLVSPNVFTKDWIQGHYLGALRQAAARDGRAREVRILLSAELENHEWLRLPLVGELPPGDSVRPDSSGTPVSPKRGSPPPPSPTPFWAERAHDSASLARRVLPFAFEPGAEQAGGLPRLGLEAREDRRERPSGEGRLGAETGAGRSLKLPAVPSTDADTLSFFHKDSDFVLNDSFTFQNFVVGKANELACAAAKAVGEFPEGPYNPLFLHGASGLGKTHLLQAICNAVIRGQKPRRVLYLSCESFVNQFIQAVSNGDLEKFRFKYRKVDMLLIDDIQSLEGKPRTQEEFFHTFNSLFNAQKQIVLSSDRPPKEIATLQERLVSRFGWGMVTSIEAPCFETRVAIINRKARLRGHEFGADVAQLLAEQIDSNIRELEGAVTKLIGYSRLMGRRIDVEMVLEALPDHIPTRRRVMIQDVLNLVSKEFGIAARELQSKCRCKSIVFPRHIGIFLARRHTRLSLEEIGGFFGGRDHSTVLHSIKRIQGYCEESVEVADTVKRLSQSLQRGGS